jgi:aminoglycoside phosphotransferase (APT) family kinase protein
MWTQTIPIDPELAKRLVESQFDLTVSSISLLGEGWDNLAYLVNSEYVFRFPRREMGVASMQNELLILPYLADKLTFPSSIPTFVGKPTDAYPAPFSGYSMLAGKPLSDTPPKFVESLLFAKQLAQWLRELHAVSVLASHRAQIKGDQSWRVNVGHRIETSKERLVKYAACFEQSGLDVTDLKSRLDAFDGSHFDLQRCYVHGDLYSRHLIVDSKTMLAGLIDWGDVHLGHPVMDLSIGHTIFSDEALEVFYSTYGTVTEEYKALCRLRALTHSIALLPYCFERGEENLKQWAIMALSR